jgi:hypothetical protein
VLGLAEWVDRSVRGVLVLEADRAFEKVGGGGVGSLVISMSDVAGIGFTTTLKFGLIVVFGLNASAL